MSVSIADRAPWLMEEHLQRLLKALSQDGDEARVVGGAVRNTLLGEPTGDIDIATTTEPRETISRANRAGFRTAPTGIDHGTITVIGDHTAYEVTTLRADTETDGRRATVAFGRDWTVDAERRDFTINALYADAAGTIHDPVGGLADIEARRLRFIGDAEARIREDYLRILRFFRFFAWYGDGRPDADGLKACVKLKDGLAQLSAERVWAETKKMLTARDPSRALLWMRQAGVLTAILPETEKWGIDAIHALVAAERDLGWDIDPMLRLEAIVPPDAPRLSAMGKRLRMSNAERGRLERFAMTEPPAASAEGQKLREYLYYADRAAALDRLRLALASARMRASENPETVGEAAQRLRQLETAETWQKPVFPISGRDLAGSGMEPGPKLGEALGKCERAWVESDFTLGRAELIDAAKAKSSKTD